MKKQKLRVGAVTYSVVWDKHKLALAVADEGLDPSYGWHDDANLVICIDPRISRQRQRVTLLHEALHAVEHQSGKPMHSCTAISDDDEREEYLVQQLTTPLLAVLRDNPWFVQFLLEGRTQ